MASPGQKKEACGHIMASFNIQDVLDVGTKVMETIRVLKSFPVNFVSC